MDFQCVGKTLLLFRYALPFCSPEKYEQEQSKDIEVIWMGTQIWDLNPMTQAENITLTPVLKETQKNEEESRAKADLVSKELPTTQAVDDEKKYHLNLKKNYYLLKVK